MGRRKGRAAKKAKQSQVGRQDEEYKKAPHSFVFNRGHVGKNVKILMKDMRHVMEPYTASKLQVKKKNVLKDFINVAGAFNVSHFVIFTKTEVSTNLRLVRIPRGPTLTFKVNEYCLSKDIISSLKKPNLEQKQFLHHPLLVMNNFSSDEMSLKLMSTMFQNMFPSINVNKVKLNNIRRCVLLNYCTDTKQIEFRHYNIKVVPVGMSRGVKKLIKANVPDMSKYNDVSEYMVRGGNISESEAELDDPQNEIILPQHMGSRGNMKQARSAIRLTEIGPRMTLQLVKIEEGVCQGEVMYHEFIHKNDQEIQALKAFREKKRKLKEIRKKKQEENVEKKKKQKEEHRQRSMKGKEEKEKLHREDLDDSHKDEGEYEDDVMEDIEYYKQEVGADPEPELFPSKGLKRKRPSSSSSNARWSKKKKIHQKQTDSYQNRNQTKRRNFSEKKSKKDFKKKSSIKQPSKTKIKRRK